LQESDMRYPRHLQRPSRDDNGHPPQPYCLLISQGTRQRRFGATFVARAAQHPVCQDLSDHDTQALDRMDDERFPSQVAPNERLSEEDKRTTREFGESFRAECQ
ncbi:hypothetical protein EV363DRAFT_1168194, partial [Boletus edulis]